MNKNIEKFLVKFNNIYGNFVCINNKLETLYGSPNVTVNFLCQLNNLKNLKYSPETVTGSFDCGSNELTSLEGITKKINGGFDCSNNNIKNIEFLPEQIKQGCILINNPELGEVQDIEDFKELKKIHESIILKKKLEQEISVDNEIKNNIIKL